MKKLIATLIVLAALALPCVAQTNSPSFFDTAFRYFTSFNTNLTTFHADQDHVDIYTGVESQQGLGMESLLVGRYNAFRPTRYTSIGIGAALRNTDISGTLLSINAELSASFVKYDTKLTGGIGVGYDRQRKTGQVEPFMEVAKALTENTYAGLRVSHDITFKKSNKSDTPLVCLFGGFNF